MHAMGGPNRATHDGSEDEVYKANVKTSLDRQNTQAFVPGAADTRVSIHGMKRVRFVDESRNEYFQLPQINDTELTERWYSKREFSMFASNALLVGKTMLVHNERIYNMWEFVVDFCRDPDTLFEDEGDDEALLIQQTLMQHYSEMDTYGLESSFLHLALPSSWPGKQQTRRKILGTFHRFDQVMGKTASRTALEEFFRKSSCHLSQPGRIFSRIIALSLEQCVAMENNK